MEAVDGLRRQMSHREQTGKLFFRRFFLTPLGVV